jgi:hypothetical protein
VADGGVAAGDEGAGAGFPATTGVTVMPTTLPFTAFFCFLDDVVFGAGAAALARYGLTVTKGGAAAKTSMLAWRRYGLLRGERGERCVTTRRTN